MTQPSPDTIMRSLGELLATKYLLVANAVGLFEALGPNRWTTLDQLAESIRVPRRTLRILADALVVTGVIERRGDEYRNGEAAATYLSGDGPDLRSVLRLWDRVVYPQWAGLEESIRTGCATFGFADFSPEQHRDFTLGVEALTAPSAHALAATYDFGPHRAVLDLGGGTGSFLRAILKAHPHLKATLVERPATAEVSRRNLSEGRAAIEIIEADFLRDPLPNGHDAVLLANVLHLFSPETNMTLLRRVRAAVGPEARLLLVDFWTDAARTQPAFAALMAGEFLIVTGEGDVYSADEVEDWLSRTGWRATDRRPLAGAASLLVATAAEAPTDAPL